MSGFRAPRVYYVLKLTWPCSGLWFTLCLDSRLYASRESGLELLVFSPEWPSIVLVATCDMACQSAALIEMVEGNQDLTDTGTALSMISLVCL